MLASRLRLLIIYYLSAEDSLGESELAALEGILVAQDIDICLSFTRVVVFTIAHLPSCYAFLKRVKENAAAWTTAVTG